MSGQEFVDSLPTALKIRKDRDGRAIEFVIQIPGVGEATASLPVSEALRAADTIREYADDLK